MAAAKSLSDLFKIRAHNRGYLDSINGTLGTALGFKHESGQAMLDEPAVIVFVPEKINRKWISPNSLIAPSLKEPGGLVCPLDVVAGGRPTVETPVPESGTALAQRLRGWDDRIWCGSQVSSSNSTTVELGSLGAFARRNSDGMLGFLTNQHVAIGNVIYHPWAPGSPNFPGGTAPIGTLEKSVVEQDVNHWYGPFAVETGPFEIKVRVDCAFIASALRRGDVSPEPLVDPTVLAPGPWGSVFDIDLAADMTDPDTRFIGADVYHVGRTTGLRKGKIVAFAYEWEDQPSRKRYADMLIAGETQPVAAGLQVSVPFSSKGDSGTMIFVQRGGQRRPIALLWGGQQEQLRGGDSQENWSYATRLDNILRELDVTLVSDAASFPV